MNTRRKFLLDLSALSAGFVMGNTRELNSSLWDRITGSETGKSKNEPSEVVVVQSSNVFNEDGNINKGIVFKMIETGVKALAHMDSSDLAWRKWFDSRARIGIKTNCLAGKMMSTRPQIVEAIASGLHRSGVKQNNIIVWERSSRELNRAGYSLNTGKEGYRCFGTDEVGYNNELYAFGRVCSRISNIVTGYCDLLINAPVLKDHNLAGLSGGMKNYYGAIHNPNKYHDSNCSPYVADVNSIPFIREKNKLTIVDALTVQCNGGPAFYPDWAVKKGMILLGTDPVAVDVVALEILEQMRGTLGLETLIKEKRYPSYIQIASDPDHRLGFSKPEMIRKNVINLETKGIEQ